MSKYPQVILTTVISNLSAASSRALDERPLPKELGERQFRRSKVEASGYDAEKHTVTMAVSSEFPVERYGGVEILSHKPGAIKMERLKQGIALLFNHDYNKHLGRSQSFELADGVLRITNKFGTNPLAREKEQDVADGILTDVSIGYQPLEIDITEDKNGVRTFTLTEWELYENSLVTVPADYTVGVERGAPERVEVKVNFRKIEDEDDDPDGKRSTKSEDDEEGDEEDEEERSTTSTNTRSTKSNTETRNMPPEVNNDTAAANQERITGLRNLRAANPKHFSESDLLDAIAAGTDVRSAKEKVVDAIIAEAGRNDVRSAATETLASMSAREARLYSRAGAARAAINVLRSGTFSDAEAGFAREVSDDIRKKAEERGVTGLGGGILTPGQMNERFAQMQMERSITSAGSTGTATNQTNVIVPPIELLRAKTICLSLGARYLPGIHGTPSFTRQTAAASSSWLAEGSSVTNSDATVGAFQMTPHRLSIMNSYYRDFLALSNLAIDEFMAQDRDQVLALSLDYAAFAGSGVSPVPLGLLNQVGLGVTLSGSSRASDGTLTNGAGGAPPTYVDLNNQEAAISTANADISTLAYATTPKVRAAMRSIPQLPGTASGMLMPNSKVGSNGVQEGPLGYNLRASTNMPTNTTVNSVANLHPLVLGCFDQLMIGDWDLNELIADNVTGAASALYKLTEHGYYDVAVRHVESFNVMFVKA